jgi:hypothetical protein
MVAITRNNPNAAIIPGIGGRGPGRCEGGRGGRAGGRGRGRGRGSQGGRVGGGDGDGGQGPAAQQAGGRAPGGRAPGGRVTGRGRGRGRGGGEVEEVVPPQTDTNQVNEVTEVPQDEALLVAFKSFLTRIGFSVAAITQLLARGLSSMESLKVQGKSCVSDMCKCIERGTTGVPGLPMNSDSIMWLKMGTYAIKHRQFCGWPTAASDLTKQELLKWKNYMEAEEAYKEPTTPPNVEKKDKLFLDLSKTFKILDLYISAMRVDTSKIPLGYIIRENEKPWNTVHSTPVSYMAIIELMNDYCPHWDLDTSTNSYQRPYYYDQDNHKVLQILLEIFQTTPAYTYIKRFT